MSQRTHPAPLRPIGRHARRRTHGAAQRVRTALDLLLLTLLFILFVAWFAGWP